jgi:hypothetical protein
MDITRRRTVVALAGLSTCGLSGCLSGLTGSDGNIEYDYIDNRPVYISENIDLEFPPQMNRVTDTGDADAVVLSPDTQASIEQIVDWLRAQKAVSVSGNANRTFETWNVWEDTDLYQEVHQSRGRAETPPPDNSTRVHVKWKKGDIVASFSSDLDSNPDGNKIVELIDMALESMDEDGSLPSDDTESQSNSTN